MGLHLFNKPVAEVNSPVKLLAAGLVLVAGNLCAEYLKLILAYDLGRNELGSKLVKIALGLFVNVLVGKNSRLFRCTFFI